MNKLRLRKARLVAAADAAGRWLVTAAVALSLLLMGGLLALLVRQAATAFTVLPIEALAVREGETRERLLVERIGEDAGYLVVRGSEWQRPGDAYRRIRIDALSERSRPLDALLLRLRDGRHLLVGEDDFAAAGDTGQLAWPGMPDGVVVHPHDIVEKIAPNRLDGLQRVGVGLARAWRFASGDAATLSVADGLLPALLGTVLLVVLMSVLVMPLGVLAALWLHEYAGRGWRAQAIRAAVNNLAAVPSVIYGLFGLALFVHTFGAALDHWFYAERVPAPTFASGGLLWASLTLALLTLPVVIVATEEGLSRVPRSLRLGALALGATRAETLWRVVLPVARPALLTGLILAVARAAGEVAPLMLVGVVKLAAALPLDGEFPYLHPSRAFMHLGYAVYDEALSGNDALRAMPRAYAAALLLVVLVVSLNSLAVLARNRLRERTRQFPDE